MHDYVFQYKLDEDGKILEKIKIFLNCDQNEANERWNSFMENHDYSGIVELVDIKVR